MAHGEPRVALLIALTFATGSVDAVSYLTLDQVFTANMTGNVALLGFAAAGHGEVPLLRTGIALLAFVAGAVAAGRLTRHTEPAGGWPGRISVALGASTALLALVVVLWPVAGRDVLAGLLGLAMGLQGGAVRRLGVADLPTTVITSTLTALAVDEPPRRRRRLAAPVALLAGAVAGALLIRWHPVLGLLPALATQAAVLAAAGAVADPGRHPRAAHRDPADRDPPRG
ncbi:YoaK family protein [Streptomyces sp. AA0539]|uniref:YoaK family protein n=1 Tax=Streptomyces sp. AA0539 TaxID=1210045 RepID=UPI0002DD5AE1|nr:YoaK family protein [Streptomyces sp. AA0539]